MRENWSENRARIKENSQSLGMTLHHRIRAMPLKNIPIREFGIRKGLKKLVISSKIRIFIGENQ